ncbi:helix-turn-helix domain-containing protein [Lysinibacillus xylanilyticus]|uniref:helix-turn-helix domain-containing protein n=1 Tax=Lysinibacillus xylanilyticus TaxID=582475 RepID=UPI002B24DD9A|nr:helix-turn-helix transcriptional regulator [Lysinibacillus xylanilyticus]MEB2281082.1 helix-turn-helix domain-containing protein [Lysinibacillus xylanilyticus]
METLGERLKLARQNAGLKQIQVKERTRINNKTLSGYENDVSEPDLTTLTVLAELYGVSLQWLSTGRVDIKVNEKIVNNKEERDIAKRLESFRAEIENSDGLAFDGEPMSDEAKESLIESMEHIFRQTQRINKKYIPKKYMDDDQL